MCPSVTLTASLLSLLSCSATLAGPDDGLMAHYTFDGAANDSTGNAFNGVPHGNVTYAAGRRGQAAHFDGTTSWIDVDHGNALTFDPDVQSYSTACWVRMEATSHDAYFFQNRYGNNESVSFNTGYNSDNGAVSGNIVWWSSGGGHVGCAPDTHPAQPFGRWTHVAMVWDHTTHTNILYIDGAEANRTQCGSSGFATNFNNHLVIGAGWGSDGAVGNFLAGDLDDLRIYERALRQDDVARLAGTPCSVDFNLDGFVDFFDYDDFVRAFERGC